MSSDEAARYRPGPTEAITTAVVALVVLVVVAVPTARDAFGSLGFVLVEIVGRVVDRPTWLLVVVYGALVIGAIGLEPIRHKLPKEALPAWLVLCCLALLGQAYIFALAWKLQPGWLVAALLATGLATAAFVVRARGRPKGEGPPLPVVPVVALFVALHVLVEGVAGHVLTPQVHAVSAWLAALSRDAGALYRPLVAMAVAAPLALALMALARGLKPIGWLHPDPRRLVDLATLPSLVALAVVVGHYETSVWGCPDVQADGLRLVSSEGGAFDLEASADGRLLLASLREPRALLLVDLDAGVERRISTAVPEDGLFDRTEPETLLALPDGRFVVLLASSDSEQGNRLALFDPTAGTLSPPLAAQGVSDLVGDGAGGVWISTEFTGRLARIDPESGATLAEIDLPGAETNKVVVEAATGHAWSAGLWQDRLLRRIDLATGRQAGSAALGTHQWDMALSARHRLLFIPRLVAGELTAWDADTLEWRGSLPARFGVRPVEVDPDGDLVVTGNLYTGEVVGREVVDGAELFRRRVGGHLKALEIGPDGRIFAGSLCGIFEIDPEGYSESSSP